MSEGTFCTSDRDEGERSAFRLGQFTPTSIGYKTLQNTELVWTLLRTGKPLSLEAIAPRFIGRRGHSLVTKPRDISGLPTVDKEATAFWKFILFSS
jgi:hypothetical protein